MILQILSSLREQANPLKVPILQRFFKTGKGEYAEGDIFIGVTVPNIRKIAKLFYQKVDLNIIASILQSKIHEERMLALIMLVYKFQKTKDPKEKSFIFNFYSDKENLKYINNWDLVDVSCYNILGEYIFNHKDKIEYLYDLAQSHDMWERRISMVSTMYFIRKGEFEPTIRIAKKLIGDKHPLIHKAQGWLLREMGKKNHELLIGFLNENHTALSRITISYATEKLTPEYRIRYYSKP